MASRRIRRRPIAPTRARPPFIDRALNSLLTILFIGLASVALFIAWPALVREFQQRTSGAPAEQLATPAPTLAPVATLTAAQLAEIAKTAAEQLALKQAIPTPDTSVPPQPPAQATATAITLPSSLDTVPAGSLSPVDTTWRPIPTPTSMLSQAQLDASQASEEQNFLNNAEQGLTEAQKLVKIHEAESNAKGQP